MTYKPNAKTKKWFREVTQQKEFVLRDYSLSCLAATYDEKAGEFTFQISKKKKRVVKQEEVIGYRVSGGDCPVDLYRPDFSDDELEALILKTGKPIISRDM
jgi:hypothetical protein